MKSKSNYLELIAQIERICNEVREIHRDINGSKNYTHSFKIKILTY